MALDLHDTDARTPFMITFTTSMGDFPSDFELALAHWHKKKCESCLLIREGGPGEDEHLHYHSVGTWKTKHAGNVTRGCATFYSKFNLAFTDRSVVVKKVTDLIGSWHYLRKSLDGRVPLLVMGWSMSWIKEQCVANVHKIPNKVLMKDKHCLSTRTATARCMEYAKAQGMVLSGKDSFATLICEMAAEGYQFEAVKLKWLYCQCMSLTGDTRPMRSMVLNELNFLE